MTGGALLQIMKTWKQITGYLFILDPVKVNSTSTSMKNATNLLNRKTSPWKNPWRFFGIWNRYEIRFSDQKAQGTIEEYINGVDLGEIARGVVNKEIQVYNGTNQFGAYKPDDKWQKLFGGVEPLTLSTNPQPYSFERTIRWLTHQVSNSLALVNEADKIMQTEYMKMIQNSGEITERGNAMLNLMKANKQYET